MTKQTRRGFLGLGAGMGAGLVLNNLSTGAGARAGEETTLKAVLLGGEWLVPPTRRRVLRPHRGPATHQARVLDECIPE